MLELPKGTLFAGRYSVERVIAKGGMGAVYEVVHVETERRRALKVMLPHLVSSDELRQRFRQEARVAAKIDSAFIVDVFDAGIDEQTKMPFLVMELLRGEELGKRLARLGVLPAREVVEYLGQTALALDKTHHARIVHRDLKPENLFLAEQDIGPPRIKVLDFGIAKLVAEQGTEANATQSIGTPMYMAPEQFLPGGKVSPATDLFSLGMMAYTLLVGSPYWREERETQGNVYAFIGAVMAGPLEPATTRALRQSVELPIGFDAWFAQATAKDPTKRFGKATEAIAALAHLLQLPWSLDGLPGRTTAERTSTPVAHDRDAQGNVLAGKTPAQVTAFGLSSSHSAAVRGVAAADPAPVRRMRSFLWLVPATAVLVVVIGIGTITLLAARSPHSAAPTSIPAASLTPQTAPSEKPSAALEPRIDVVAPLMSASASTNTVAPRINPKTPPPQKVVAAQPSVPEPAPAPAPKPAPRPTATWGD
ncbi:MAG TPA: serine/threonine-protein kinase [Polyangium sp.]|nr:serine/threonine-protein kinase [Polyangium sp.]